jgi:hypothetical protein
VPVSQNGWSANDRSVITSYLIGSRTRVSLRSGPAGEMLQHLGTWFDANIADVDNNYNNGALDDWGYAERAIRGGVELSNHASGTALDVNATEWPLGVEPTVYLTQAQIARIRQQLLVYGGCIRWGGDYEGRKDPMHFEINRDVATVTARWALIKTGATPVVPVPPPPTVYVPKFPLPTGHYFGLITGPKESHGGYYAYERPYIVRIQQQLIRKGCVPGVVNPASSWADGKFELPTERAARVFQSRSGLVVDGKVGPKTWSRLMS